MSVSPSRITAIDETLRSTVGRDADVPRKRRVSDMRAKYIVALRPKGNAVCLSRCYSKTLYERVRCQREPEGNHRHARAPQRVRRPLEATATETAGTNLMEATPLVREALLMYERLSCREYVR